MEYDDIMGKIKASSYGDWEYDDELGVYIFKKDVNLTIKQDRSTDGEIFNEPWDTPQNYAPAHRGQCYIMYGATTIKKVHIMELDDHRMPLPIPYVSRNNGDTEYSYDDFGWALAKIMAGHAAGKDDFKMYMERTGIVLLNNSDPNNPYKLD